MLSYKHSRKKKKLVLFGNCHFNEIRRNIIQYTEIKQNYLPYYICINNYIGYGDVANGKKSSLQDKTYFTDEHLNLLKTADIFIYQNIETNRGFLNNKEVLKYIKKSCIKIKIPHYRSSIYHYNHYKKPYFKDLKEKTNKITNNKEKLIFIKNYITNINNKSYDKKDLDNFINEQLSHFKKIDNYSDVSMYNFFINNWKKIQLINGRSYPTSYFMFILSKKILEKINIYQNLSLTKMIQNRILIPKYFGEFSNIPIFNFWYNYNNFSFKNQYYWYTHIPMTDYEFYYLQIKISNKLGDKYSFNEVVWIDEKKLNILEEINLIRNI